MSAPNSKVLTVGMLSSMHGDGATGAKWRILNNSFAEQRRSMVWLYGNRRRLFGRWQVLMAAYDHTLFPMFAIQVWLECHWIWHASIVCLHVAAYFTVQSCGLTWVMHCYHIGVGVR